MLLQLILPLVWLIGSANCKAPQIETKSGVKETVLLPLDPLPEELKECSGMIILSNHLFVAHNDSGNKPWLYIFDKNKKIPLRIVKVKGVKNHDWEELAEDDQYIYIGDTGNNGGKRQNLMIYRVRKDSLLAHSQVRADTISFSYADQTRFEDSNRHNFDCEAMICKGDSLFLFTKNRGDFRTNVYGFPKIPGKYVAQPMGSFDCEGLVTGADFRGEDQFGNLVILGYSIHGKAFYPFILHFPKVKGSAFFEGEVHRTDFRIVLQTESILFSDSDEVIITNEEEDNSEGFLYRYHLSR